ncbi:MAG: hypothetical protein ACPGU1_10935 [Myxococcota bacterium]
MMNGWLKTMVVVGATLLMGACGGGAEEPTAPTAPGDYEGDEPGECSDGADNDQDQAFDCDDPGCAGAPICNTDGPDDQDATSGEEDAPAPTPPDAATIDDTSSVEDTPEGPEDVEEDTGPEVTPEPEPEPEPVDPAAPCPALVEATGTIVEVSPSDLDDLRLQLASAAEGTTFLFTDGVYDLDGEALWVPTKGTTLRSKSGNRDAVILDGGGETAIAVQVAASDVKIAELTLSNLSDHGVRVQPEPGQASLTNVSLYGVKIVDALNRAVSVDGYNQAYVDAGEVACSHITLTDEGREAVADGCDIGGIDLRQAAYWTLRDNQIDNLWCDKGTAAPAILAWRSSAYTLIERNRIDDCSRGIGLGEAQSPLAGERSYLDQDCDISPHVDHYRGVVRNNMLFVGGEAFVEANPDYESGIHLWSCCYGAVVHNTVVGFKAPYSSIEWRREGTIGGQVLNNLVSHNLRERTGAEAFTLGNLEQAEETLFVDQEAGDLHLLADVLGAINAGEDIQVGLADHDFEGDPRLGARDIGADELVE